MSGRVRSEAGFEFLKARKLHRLSHTELRQTNQQRCGRHQVHSSTNLLPPSLKIIINSFYTFHHNGQLLQPRSQGRRAPYWCVFHYPRFSIRRHSSRHSSSSSNNVTATGLTHSTTYTISILRDTNSQRSTVSSEVPFSTTA